MTHPKIRHPRTLLVEETGRFNGWVTRVAASSLGSITLFWVTFLVPLAVIPAPDGVKLIASILLSSWFQAWALPVLQRASNQADALRQAKADTDHDALTHVAQQLDDLSGRVDTLHAAVVASLTPTTPSRKGPGPVDV